MSETVPSLAELGPIGFVGLGHMGAPMVRRLLAAGGDVYAYDVVPEAVAAAAEAGARAVSQLQDLAGICRTIILMLPNSDVVDSVLAEMLDPVSDSKVHTVVDMSSSEPLRTRAAAARLEQRGITLVDAPVSGGVRGAEAGSLTVMVGGPEDAVQSVHPLLAAMGSQITHTGPSGAGHAVKALNNLLSAAHMIATTEALVVAARFGLDPETVLSVVNTSSGRSGSTEVKFPRFVLPRTFDSGFSAALLKKDVGIAVGLAESLSVDVPVAESVLAGWTELVAELGPTADHTEAVRPYESRAEVKLTTGRRAVPAAGG